MPEICGGEDADSGDSGPGPGGDSTAGAADDADDADTTDTEDTEDTEDIQDDPDNKGVNRKGIKGDLIFLQFEMKFSWSSVRAAEKAADAEYGPTGDDASAPATGSARGYSLPGPADTPGPPPLDLLLKATEPRPLIFSTLVADPVLPRSDLRSRFRRCRLLLLLLFHLSFAFLFLWARRRLPGLFLVPLEVL